MTSVTEACRIVLSRLGPPSAEVVALEQAKGRVLARAVRRRFAQPPFTRSRVDGYAVSAADLGGDAGKAVVGGDARATGGNAPTEPLSLVVSGVVLAGDTPPGVLPAGKALRVMAGAPLPAGVGAVVAFEEVPEVDGAPARNAITLLRRPSPAENVIPAGREGRTGDVVLAEGAVCGPVELGLLAAAGEAEVCVRRLPRVAVITTGSELIPLGRPLTPGKIYASNSHLLSGLVAAWGGIPITAGPIPDRWPDLSDALRSEARACDVVVVTGGVAAGDADLSRRALDELGWRVLLDGVDFHPGGRCVVAEEPDGGTLVFFLSGGPGACLTAAALLLIPALAKLGGGGWKTVTAILGACPVDVRSTRAAVSLSWAKRRQRAVPVALRLAGGRLWAWPLPRCPGAPAISRGTDGFLLLPAPQGEKAQAPRSPAETACEETACEETACEDTACEDTARGAEGPEVGGAVEVWPVCPLRPSLAFG